MASLKKPGYSDNTPLKQQHLADIAGAHWNIVAKILRKNHDWASQCYLCIDLNAGPGLYHTGEEGSPLVFGKTAQVRRLPTNILCIEKVAETYARLKQVCDAHYTPVTGLSPRYNLGYPLGELQIYHGDSFLVLPDIVNAYRQVAKKIYGMAYSDPNGHLREQIPGLKVLAQAFPRLDLVCHASATIVKRCFASPRHAQYDQRLSDLVMSIGKRYWLVREPFGPQGWTFLIGTNWTDFPEFKKLHIYDVRSQEGLDILDTLSYSSRERLVPREKKRPSLSRIVLTKNISVIQGSLGFDDK